MLSGFSFSWQGSGGPQAWTWRQERTLLHRWPACAVALAPGGAALAAAGLAGQLWLWRLHAGAAEPMLLLQVCSCHCTMKGFAAVVGIYMLMHCWRLCAGPGLGAILQHMAYKADMISASVPAAEKLDPTSGLAASLATVMRQPLSSLRSPGTFHACSPPLLLRVSAACHRRRCPLSGSPASRSRRPAPR